ncbi:MAG: hypothetical protein ABIW83_02825 [Allosphingosinicella sp.]
MEIHAFRGLGRVFGFTREAEGSNLPGQYGPWAPFKTLEMNPGQALPGVDVETCLADVEAHGFHLTDAHVRITEQAVAGGFSDT